VYLSSGTVFRSPRGEVLDENAQPDPLNIYGMTKYLAELTVRDHLPQRSLIVRTGWVFGDHGARHRKYVDVAIEKALANQSIWANATQDGSWTYVADLVQELRRLIASDVHGVRHVINSGAGTGLNLAQEIRSILGSQAPVVTDQASQGADSAIPRSPSEVLTTLYEPLRPWREALRHYIEDLKARRALPF
jgi:dTDP-4-dehydrorhamnose reductase